MLVLTRKPDESIFIGDQIEIVVLKVKGDQVRLGIRAPKEIAVHRQEVAQRIQVEQQANTNGSRRYPRILDERGRNRPETPCNSPPVDLPRI